MKILPKSRKGEALQLMLTFGSLLISLISLVVAIVKNDKKK